MDNITINPKQTPENESSNQEIKKDLNAENTGNTISENKTSEIEKENLTENTEKNPVLSYQTMGATQMENAQAPEQKYHPVSSERPQTPVEQPVNYTSAPTPQQSAYSTIAQQPQQSSQQNVPPQAATSAGQIPLVNSTVSQAVDSSQKGFATATHEEQRDTKEKATKENNKAKKTPVKPSNQPKSKKAKNKTKNVVVTLGFVAGLTCAAILFAVGTSMNGELTKQNLLNPVVRPTIEIKEPQDLENSLSTIQIVQKVEPSVVSIDVYSKDELQVAGSGSGVIFSEDGYIVTNAHVVEDAYALRVILNDETGYTATLVGEDINNDLAVIKINAEGLTAAEFGDSDQVQMGEKVIAIGNAVGIFPGSPTQGIISGVNRQLSASTEEGSTIYQTLLQTDAAINPGNSGGALVNSYGQVIGINVAKISYTDIDNIGFAIPSNTVTSTVENIFKQEESNEIPSIGLAFVELNETNGPSNNLPSSGLYIELISENSDLYLSDVEKGDIVTAINGQEVKTTKEVREIFAGLREGDTVELTVLNPTTEETFTAEAKLYDSAFMSEGYPEEND